MGDVFAGGVWLGTTFLLLAASWRISGWLLPADLTCQRLLHSGVITWAALVTAATLLGLTGVLTGPLLTTVIAIAATSVLVITRGQNIKASLFLWFPNRIEWFYHWGWLILTSCLFGWVVVAGVCNFPNDWDSLNYHLPLIDQWLAAQNLYAPNCREWYVPGNNEIVGLWTVCLFSGDFLVGLMNLPAAGILVLGTLELGRNLGQPRPLFHLTALAVLSSGVVLRQFLSAKNDLAAAALFVTALAYVLRHSRDKNAETAILAAMAIGLLAGIKYYALGYAFVAAGSWILCGLLQNGIKTGCLNGLWAFTGGLAWGGYWYVRNALLTGTPLFPKGPMWGTDMMSEWRGGVWSTTLFGNGSEEVFPLTLEAVWTHAGLIHYYAGLGIPALVLWLTLTGTVQGLKWIDSAGRISRITLAAALMGAGLIWGMTPFAVEAAPGTLFFLREGYLTARFGLCFLTLAVVGLASVVSDLWESFGTAEFLLGRIARKAILAVAMVGVGWHLFVRLRASFPLANFDVWLVSLNVLLVIFIVTETLRTWPLRKMTIQLITLVIMAATFATFCYNLAQSWHKGFANYYQATFNDSTVSKVQLLDPKSTMLCTLLFRNYPFFGSHRQFPVCSPLWLRDDNEFRRYVWNEGITHVISDRHDPSWIKLFDRIHQWVTKRPEVFPTLIAGDRFTVYRVEKEALWQTFEISSAPVPYSGKPGP